jgi:hypothetical protein
VRMIKTTMAKSGILCKTDSENWNKNDSILCRTLRGLFKQSRFDGEGGIR